MTDDWYERLPRKIVAAGALLYDGAGRLLIVKPTYREKWTLPGGVVEAGESPREGCEREVLEEIGLARSVGRVLAVDWRGVTPDRPERLMFLFEGGVLTDAEVAAIRLPPDELSDHRFVAPTEAPALVLDRTRQALEAALALGEGRSAYVEDGIPH